MPRYDYYCEPCQLKFETIKPMSQCSENVSCPKCGSSSERVYGVVNFSFGWRLSERSDERGGPTDEFVRDV